MKKIVITNNSSKYIFLFKRNLILSLIEEGFSVTVIAPRDKYSGRFAEIGAAYTSITMETNGLNPFKDLVLLRDLFNIYKKIRPDSNLLFTIKPNVFGTIASAFLGIKTINNVTGLGSVFLNPGFVQLIVRMLYKLAFKFSTKIMFQNSEDRDFFTEQSLVNVAKTVLIPGSGVDIKRFRPMSGAPKDNMVFLMIGRVLVDKGALEYVEAARLVKNQDKNVEFWLLGGCESDSRSSINRKTIADWERQALIKYLGEVEDVREVISNADVVVLPSYREGMPRVLLEALAMEKPIIGSDVPGCRDIVQDGVNGYFCKVKDPLDLSKQIRKMMLLDQETRDGMGKNGRIQIIEKFDEKIVINTYVRLLKSFSHHCS